jgi:phospholipid/cholesterol/gamma-HCH transport system substrate-binding protein
MKKIDWELLVGLLMLCGLVVLVYVSLRLGQIDLGQARGYTLYADFTNAGGLQNGAVVELAGVEIGRVQSVGLEAYQAKVTLRIRNGIMLPADTRATIKTKGLIGERYVEITPGTGNGHLQPGERIAKTESPVDINELISQFIFGTVEGGTPAGDTQSDGANPWDLGLD